MPQIPFRVETTDLTVEGVIRTNNGEAHAALTEAVHIDHELRNELYKAVREAQRQIDPEIVRIRKRG